jgi:nucleoside-diphosphate-sugar epimerase
VTRSALVTGATGFVGRWLTQALINTGWTVCALDIRPPRSPVCAVPPGYYGSLLDARTMFDGHQRFDLVAHCAAVVGGRAVIDHDPLAQAVNLELDAALFRYARLTRPDHVLYFSSSAAYPVRYQSENGFRLRESYIDLDDPQLPDALYGWTKLTGELLARLYARDGGRVHVLRPFSGYGADQDLDYPFPAFIARAAAREDPFVVWGSGEQIRDWVHIDDVVGTALAMVEQDHRGPLNVGWGVPVPFRRLAELVTAAAGYHPEITPLADRPAGVSYRVCDPLALCALRSPRVSLTEGIARALAAAGVAR